MRILFVISLATLLGTGCGEPLPTHTSAHATVDGGAEPDAGAPVHWVACPLYVDQPNGLQAECATIDVPLRWSEPDGPTIGIFVQRLKGLAAERRGQLWLLEGGPGGSGADFDGFMEQFRTLDPTLDLYAVDHRGVGRSARLSCPDQEGEASAGGFNITDAEWPACIAALQAEWGPDLAEFPTTAAARDVGRLLEVTREPGKQSFVYGVSYGTYWAHRYLQLFPSQATAVVLDSIAPPGEDFTHYDVDYNAVGQDLMDVCAADALCSSKLGADPWAALGHLFDLLDQGHCPALTQTLGFDRMYLRYSLGVLLMSVDTRAFIPAVAYRFERCDDADVAAITQLSSVLFGQQQLTYYDTLMSTALFNNVAISELWPESAPPLAEFLAEVDGLFASIDLSPRVAALQDAWPRYPDDAYVGQWATTDLPLLMMNGDLDPQTPIWVGSQADPHFNGANQRFYTIPRAAHCTIAQSPVSTAGAQDCGMQLLLGFLADPLVAPDDSCLADLAPVDFTGNAAYSQYLFGTADMWDDATARAPKGEGSPPPSLQRSLRSVRPWLTPLPLPHADGLRSRP